MKTDKFNEILETALSRIKSTLGHKSGEYSDNSNDDRLHNFRVIAHLFNLPIELIIAILAFKINYRTLMR